jgi:putative tryptophan/tyrosine transport system substrate-binding protein
MRRIGLAVVLAGSLVLAPLGGEAQQAARIPSVGILRPGTADPTPISIDAFRQGMRELGYVEGQTIALAYRFSGERPEELPTLAADLIRLKVDLLFASGRQAISAAIGASRTIPIVGVDLETDPVESGFIASFARPGGNVTGLFVDQPALTGKLLELLREVAPGARQIAVLWDTTTGPYQVRAIKVAAQSLSLEVQVLELRSPAEIEVVLRKAMRGRPHALIELSSPLIASVSKRVVEFSARNRLPLISMLRRSTDDGGLMTYGPDLRQFFGRTAYYVDKILKGVKPTDLPVEQPTKFELVINLKTAKALGLTIPQSLLGRADEIIQ